jgi:hypothetical protein
VKSVSKNWIEDTADADSQTWQVAGVSVPALHDDAPLTE